MVRRKKTQEEFVAEVFALVGDEFEVQSKYESYHKKILIKHNKCGNTIETRPSTFLNPNYSIRCKHCRYKNLSKKFSLSHEEFVKKVEELVGKKFTVLGQYVNSDTKIEMRSNECGHEFEIEPYNFLDRKRCSVCNKNEKKTPEQFVAEVFELVGNEYSVKTDYVNAKTNVEFYHNKCGEISKIIPSNFISGQRCKPCTQEESNKKQRHTHEQFEMIIKKMYGDDYTILSKYINGTTKVLVRHNVCGHKYDVKPNNLKSEKQCPKCRRGIQRTTQMYIDEVFELVGDEYTILGEFTTIHEGVLTRHNKCGHEWNPAPSNFLHGRKRCPKCNASHGELEIAKWLDTNNIHYIPQFRIDECKNIISLPFDFAVFKEDDSFILIEYQGEQHYKEIDIFGGKEGFKQRKINDQIKKDYCKKTNISLLEIPYWELDNIEQILNEKLFPLDLIKQNQSNKSQIKQLELMFN